NGDKKAKQKRLEFLKFLASLWVVDDVFLSNGVVNPTIPTTLLAISTIVDRDEVIHTISPCNPFLEILSFPNIDG
ncbi:unnamed protein product, partial [Brassica rapa]